MSHKIKSFANQFHKLCFWLVLRFYFYTGLSYYSVNEKKIFPFKNLINAFYVKIALGNLPSCVFGHIILEGQITAIEYINIT